MAKKRRQMKELVDNLSVLKKSIRSAMGAGHPEWEDVYMDTVLGIVAKIKSGEFRGDCAMGTFMYVISKRRMADVYRNGKRPVGSAETELAYGPDHEERYEMAEAVKFMRSAMARLLPHDKVMLRYRYMMEMTYEEISSWLGFGKAKAKKKVEKALQALRAECKKEGGWR